MSFDLQARIAASNSERCIKGPHRTSHGAKTSTSAGLRCRKPRLMLDDRHFEGVFSRQTIKLGICAHIRCDHTIACIGDRDANAACKQFEDCNAPSFGASMLSDVADEFHRRTLQQDPGLVTQSRFTDPARKLFAERKRVIVCLLTGRANEERSESIRESGSRKLFRSSRYHFAPRLFASHQTEGWP